jgi:hypothetical protein
MKIAIVIVTRDTDVRAHFDKLKGAVVPKELRNGGVQYSTLPVDASCNDDELFKILLNAQGKHNAVGVLVEAGLEERFSGCFPAVFLKAFDLIEANNNMMNYFGHNLTRWLKNLIYLSRAFSDGKQQKCLLLPFGNFAAAESAEIVQVCREDNDSGAFQELLENKLKRLRNRSVPKKRKSGRQHFLKDDYDRYFELGKEKHGQSETRVPPHVPECEITAWARFGVTLNRSLHYNITLETGDISGQFNNCHNANAKIKPRGHINMFPNGFIR